MIQQLLGALLVVLSASPPAFAAATDKPAPATKIEAFQEKKGAVIIMGFTEIGKVEGALGSSVMVQAREFRDAANPKSRSTGILIEVTRGDDDERSFIDADEVDGLLKGIDYISKVSSVSGHRNFEAEFTTKGEFSITVYNSSEGTLNVSVESGRIGRQRAYLSMSQLGELRKLITSAKSKL